MEKTRIKDLEANKGANVEGEIIKLDATKEVRTKFGKLTKTQKVIIKDSSGNIELQLWEDYCDKFQKGDNIEIKGGWVSEYKGELQLSTGKFGKIGIIQIESEPIAEKPQPKTEFVPANQLKLPPNENQVRDWSMRRGGYGHDSATIVAALINKSILNPKSLAEANDFVVIGTDSLVKAAEEREIKFRRGN